MMFAIHQATILGAVVGNLVLDFVSDVKGFLLCWILRENTRQKTDALMSNLSLYTPTPTLRIAKVFWSLVEYTN